MRACSRWPSRKHSASSAFRCSTSSGGRRRTAPASSGMATGSATPPQQEQVAGLAALCGGHPFDSGREAPGDRPSIEYRLDGQPGGRLLHRAGGGWCRADDHQTQGCGGSHLHPRDSRRGRGGVVPADVPRKRVDRNEVPGREAGDACDAVERRAHNQTVDRAALNWNDGRRSRYAGRLCCAPGAPRIGERLDVFAPAPASQAPGERSPPQGSRPALPSADTNVMWWS